MHRLLFLFALLIPAVLATRGMAAGPEPQACFTPDDNCTAFVVHTIEAAQNTILVQAYAFNSEPIARALTDAYKRGVKVRVILDKSNRFDRSSATEFVAHAGVPVWIDPEHKIAHNKVMILDDETVITGSFDFANAAQANNAENVLVIHDRDLATLYAENWQRHASHSEIYSARGFDTRPANETQRSSRRIPIPPGTTQREHLPNGGSPPQPGSATPDENFR